MCADPVPDRHARPRNVEPTAHQRVESLLFARAATPARVVTINAEHGIGKTLVSTTFRYVQRGPGSFQIQCSQVTAHSHTPPGPTFLAIGLSLTGGWGA